MTAYPIFKPSTYALGQKAPLILFLDVNDGPVSSLSSTTVAGITLIDSLVNFSHTMKTEQLTLYT